MLLLRRVESRLTLVCKFWVPSKLWNIAFVISLLISSTSLDILKFVRLMFLAVSSLRSSILMFFIGVWESKIRASVSFYFNPTLLPILLATLKMDRWESGPRPLNICKLGELSKLICLSMNCLVIDDFLAFPRSLSRCKFCSKIRSYLTRLKFGFATLRFNLTNA